MNFNIKDYVNTRDTVKKGVKGKVVFRDAKTNDIIFIKDNLVVNKGKTFIRNNISASNNDSFPTFLDYIGYFKVGGYTTTQTGLESTLATDTSLKNPISFENANIDSYSVADTIEIVDMLSPSNYSGDKYIIKYDSVATTTTIYGKVPYEIDNISFNNAVMFKLRLTPDDFPQPKKINELGLFLLRKNLDSYDGVSLTSSISLDNDEETMFSRVTFDEISLDGNTEIFIEYYIYF